MLPSLPELTGSARVVSLPLRQPFRGITSREALLFEGPQGWTEFSPFVEYDDTEAASWLEGAIDFGWLAAPAVFRSRIRVNATLPAVEPGAVAGVLDAFPGCRTVKVKVAQLGQVLADDVARVAAARDYVGVEGRIRIDANGGWNVDEAEHAVHALAGFDLEYVEQPCASVEELADIRQRVKYMGIPVAADESVRKASDPLEVARAGAADLLVIKAQPLGGIRASLDIVAATKLPVVVSSALDTSVGISMGAYLAAGIPELDYDCGLGTAALLAGDVTSSPLIPVDGSIEVRRVEVDAALLDRYAAPVDRTEWWLERLERCHALLAGRT
ncbi:o-succinylbenzoate synthase [Marisediminicola antarctica]|uniref:o-succinylbenzoate synthase n=1 Tax=Marisediminicola antarctica TaxID=674079 RepID=A0A7L5AJE4_9MICO|nr:o-succinylbenzoate synthase [Marisediminicola antarctica]QHO68409.1 O-succinylbenzoate synthase [Marisediminicola antarctica]